MEKRLNTNLKLLKDEDVTQEIKIFIILEMVYHAEISLNKAKELCTECGIFTDHWMVMDAKATEVFSKTIGDVN